MVVVTNGLRIAVALDSIPEVKTFVTGGRLRTSSGSILGDYAAKFLDNFRADLAIMSCSCVDANGIYMASEEQSSIKRKMMTLADKTILLVDHSKFNKTSYYKLSAPNGVAAIISDEKPDAALLKAWEAQNVEVLY